MVGVEMQVVLTLAEAAGPVPAQRIIVVTRPRVNGRRAERGGPGAGLMKEQGPDAQVLMIGVHGDRLDRGENSVHRQVQNTDYGPGIHGDQFCACGWRGLCGHHVVEVRGAQEGQHAAPEPVLLICWLVVANLYGHGLILMLEAKTVQPHSRRSRVAAQPCPKAILIRPR
jgi:hypothetical protein